ncbi:MAG: hypothetical protein ACRD26_20980, partial [Vicinamibacterales bacterium]
SAAAAGPVRRLFQAGDAAARAAARQRLTSLAAAGQPAVEVWDAAGNPVLELAGPPAPDGRRAAALPATVPSTPA